MTNRGGKDAGPRWPATWLVLIALGAASCDLRSAAHSETSGTASEHITKGDLNRELKRLPPQLREKFETSDGRRELAQSLLDKRLLEDEARHRHLQDDPKIREQVDDLENSLLLKALLADEEKAVGSPTEQEARAWYESNKKTLTQPERVRVRRFVAAVPSRASSAVKVAARRRAEDIARRLRRGDSPESLAALNDGPEKANQGDMGFVPRGGFHDPDLEKAAFGLHQPNEVSPVVAVHSGFAILQLIQREEARLPPFEEIRSEVEARMQPEFKRQIFNNLVARLRKASGASAEIADVQ